MICWDFTEIEQASQLRYIQNFFVKVIREELLDQRVNVCIEHPHSGAVPLIQRGISPIHVKFAIFENGEPELERLVYYLIEFSTFHCNKIRIEKTKVDALRFLSEARRLIHICKNFDAGALGNIFDRLFIWSNVHQFEKVTLALVFSAALRSVVLN